MLSVRRTSSTFRVFDVFLFEIQKWFSTMYKPKKTKSKVRKHLLCECIRKSIHRMEIGLWCWIGCKQHCSRIIIRKIRTFMPTPKVKYHRCSCSMELSGALCVLHQSFGIVIGVARSLIYE